MRLATIEGFGGDYAVSDTGLVISYKSGWPTELRQRRHNAGYRAVSLSRDGATTTCLVHRLVATAFLSNPDRLPEVNHINGRKTDNRLENLEWADRSWNTRHSWNIGLRSRQRRSVQAANRARGTPVIGMSVDGHHVTAYPTMSDAEQDGFSHSQISRCVAGRRKTHRGYRWMGLAGTDEEFDCQGN